MGGGGVDTVSSPLSLFSSATWRKVVHNLVSFFHSCPCLTVKKTTTSPNKQKTNKETGQMLLCSFIRINEIMGGGNISLQTAPL